MSWTHTHTTDRYRRVTTRCTTEATGAPIWLHHVAGRDAHRPIQQLELLDGNKSFGFEADVNDDFLLCHLQDVSCENLALYGRREVTVVLHEVFIVSFRRGSGHVFPPVF